MSCQIIYFEEMPKDLRVPNSNHQEACTERSENLPSVTKKQKRLSTIVSITVSISVSVISGLLIAKITQAKKKKVTKIYALPLYNYY